MTNENDKDVQFLKDQLEKNPDSLLFARLAEAYLQMQEAEMATKLCEEGTKKHPYYVSGHLVLGKCYLANKQYDQAEKEFKRVLLFDPKHLAAHKLYGDLMQEIGWENTGENSYKRILQIDPLDSVTSSQLSQFSVSGKGAAAASDAVESPEVEGLAASGSIFDEASPNLEAVEPLPLSSDEEEMLFEGETQEVEEKSAPPESALAEDDETNTAKFSSILDDIFKDEVVEEEIGSKTDTIDIYSSEDDLVSGIQADTETSESAEPRDEETPARETEGVVDADDGERAAEPLTVTEDHSEQKQSSFHEQYEEPPEPEPEPPKPTPAKKVTKEKIVTPTLGEIYAAQGQYAKAISVFEMLLKKHPDDETFVQKIEQLKEKLADKGNGPKN